jgi:hypothetical protein
MIIFPLITPWMWFQILTASSIDTSADGLEDGADVSPQSCTTALLEGADP